MTVLVPCDLKRPRYWQCFVIGRTAPALQGSFAIKRVICALFSLVGPCIATSGFSGWPIRTPFLVLVNEPLAVSSRVRHIQ